MKPHKMEDGRVLSCMLDKTWPPHWAKFGTAEQLRDTLTPIDYQRGLTWETVCGLTSMKEEKCLSCVYVKVDGKLVNNTAGKLKLNYEPMRDKHGRR